jgi:GxxExxY protein
MLIEIETIKQIATKIMTDLGSGYSESIYQVALFNKLVKLDPSAVTEKSIPVVYDNELIGTCRADIVTSEHVIEIKAGRTMPLNVAFQIGKYQKNILQLDSVSRTGVVVNFNQETQEIDFLTFPPPPETLYPREFKRRKAGNMSE